MGAPEWGTVSDREQEGCVAARTSNGVELTMATDSERITELELEMAHLMKEVERYRTAAEDALQQLDWCIGYFAGSHKAQLARSLSVNRTHIRRQFMRRAEQSLPSKPDSQRQAG